MHELRFYVTVVIGDQQVRTGLLRLYYVTGNIPTGPKLRTNPHIDDE